MDNLTHSLAAVLLARAGLSRLAPRATLLAVAAANLPDLDIVSGAGGSLCYLAHHRGFTHALFWLPLLALAPLPLWWLLARRAGPVARRQWLGAAAISAVALLSHLALDSLNVYGIRLLLPFSSTWLHSDLVHIVDVWIWVVLLVCTLGPLLARLVNSEIGATAHTAGRGMAWAGLLMVCAYVGLRAHNHDRAIELLNSRLYQGQAPQRVLALPSIANPWQWTGLAETASFWRIVPVNLLDDFDPESGRTLYKPDPQSFRQAVLATGTARVFLDFAQCPVWRITPESEPEGSVRLAISDLRFGLPGEGAFTAVFHIDARGRVLSERFEFGRVGAGRPIR